jgi:hypothetical protein
MPGSDVRNRQHDLNLVPQRQVVTVEPGAHRRITQLHLAVRVGAGAVLDDHAAEVFADPPFEQQRLGQVDHRPVDSMCAPIGVGHDVRHRRQAFPHPRRRVDAGTSGAVACA